MRITLISISQKPTTWMSEGLREWRSRIPLPYQLDDQILPPKKLLKHADKTIRIQEEGKRILAATPLNCQRIALDEHGKLLNSHAWAQHISQWQSAGIQPCFWIGGADGLSPEILEKADTTLSLSPMTFPHLLEKLVVIEQIYRAITILNNHPYHRS
jgi:23S rRNA (pseudouridine1915-N3)-methyltransferase